MAIIRKKELAGMNPDELRKRKEQLETEVHSERGAIATHGKPNNAGRYKEMRRTIARINTLLAKKKG
ncbi:MAG: 50S ribosomal protein L29 [Candidatus Micrarchaeota archaeon]